PPARGSRRTRACRPGRRTAHSTAPSGAAGTGAGGKVVAKGGATTLELGAGSSEPELAELAGKIRSAAERFKAEGGAEDGK
ncbi:MAG: hypothetical protein ABMB14_30360, partial [Myxococcota bacterium]